MAGDLDELGRELDEIQKEKRAEQEAIEARERSLKLKAEGGRAGGDFLASVIAGGVVGYIIDYFAGTLPWGMILFLILGFVAGVYRANNAPK